MPHWPSTTLHTAAAALLLALSGCGGKTAELSDPSGKFRVVGQCSSSTLSAALAQHDDAKLVVAFEQPVEATTAAIERAERPQRPFLILVGGDAADGGAGAEVGAELPAPDAAIRPATGARAAVELALLACNGVALPPNRIELGPVVTTPANVAAGGNRQHGPGDFYLAQLRSEHAAHLDPELEIDVAFGIGLIAADDTDSAWTRRIVIEVQAAAAAFPQVMLLPKPAAAAEPLTPAETARRHVEAGARALLLATSDPATTRAVREAVAQNAEGNTITVIVLDPLLNDGHEACHVGCPPSALGRLAAQQVERLLPEGGALLTCIDSESEAVARAEHDAFCSTMQLRP